MYVVRTERKNAVHEPVTFTATASSTPRLPYGPVASGVAIVTAADAATSLSWYVSATPEGQLYPAYDSSGALVTSIQAGRAYAVPDSLAAAPFVAAVANSGTATVVLCVKG